MAFEVAWTTLRRMEKTRKERPGGKNSRSPERAQQTPPPNNPMLKANLTPRNPRLFPMKGVTRKATRQLMPMMTPYSVAEEPFNSAILG